MFSKISTRALAASAVLCVLSAPANALTTFDWSFSNEDGPEAGTVSGSVTLPDGEGTFTATDFVIESVPAGFPLVTGFATPVTFSELTVFQESWVVSGGQIDISATTVLYGFNGSTAIGFGADNGADPDISFLDLPDAGGYGATGIQDLDSSTLSFTTAAVPLPFAAPLLGAAIAGFAGLRSLRRRHA